MRPSLRQRRFEFLPRRIARTAAAFLALTLSSIAGVCQSRSPGLPPTPAFPLTNSPIGLVQLARPRLPLTVVGPRGAFLGQQNGDLEAWVFPDKIFSHLQISARLKDYPVPINVNQLVSVVDVEPCQTTITYSHAAFTIREILFAPRTTADGTGVIALFRIDSVRPLRLTFSFTPEMKRAWPAPNFGVPSPEWVPTSDGSGYYILHTNSSALAGAIALPGAHSGILQPYQERPHFYPLQFVLDFNPKSERDRYFPLLMAVGNTAASATNAALASNLRALNRNIPELYKDQIGYYSGFFKDRLTISTPDPQLDTAYRWALLSIDDQRIRLFSDGEVGLTAGFYPSGDSARPGFGWYFGRDTLWTVYALDAEGDFSTTREAIEFLLRRQRADGKIMHEYAQTAQVVDWQKLPYEYAAADSNPLLLMATADYLRASGDKNFVRIHWPQLLKAWHFETTHDSADGIYNNSNGTGWVESWPGGMPHQEIYLASLDVEASTAMARLASAYGDDATAAQAKSRAANLAATVAREYAMPNGFYAFSRNPNGSLDTTATIYPTVAWWDGTFSLPKSAVMFSRWASHEFSTDWGTRDLSEDAAYYDPISYHQGSVWPLFTGWTSLADYRAGHPLAGYAHLMQNAQLTYAQDPGAVTELLSGAFYQPLGRSTSRQMWSSAMVVSPLLRGLFGLEWNAATRTLYMSPHLPANWDHAALHHVSLGTASFDLDLTRQSNWLVIQASGAPAGVRLASHTPGALSSDSGQQLRIPLPPVEVELPIHLPWPGSRTRMTKILSAAYTHTSLDLILEGYGGSKATLLLRRNAADGKLHLMKSLDDAPNVNVADDQKTLTVPFPPGHGYSQRRIVLSWATLSRTEAK